MTYLKPNDLDRDFCILWSRCLIKPTLIYDEKFLYQLGCLAELGQVNAIQNFVKFIKDNEDYVDTSKLIARHPKLKGAIIHAIKDEMIYPENMYLADLCLDYPVDYLEDYRVCMEDENPFITQRYIELSMENFKKFPAKKCSKIIERAYNLNPNDILTKFSYAKLLMLLNEGTLTPENKALFKEIANLELSDTLKENSRIIKKFLKADDIVNIFNITKDELNNN